MFANTWTECVRARLGCERAGKPRLSPTVSMHVHNIEERRVEYSIKYSEWNAQAAKIVTPHAAHGRESLSKEICPGHPEPGIGKFEFWALIEKERNFLPSDAWVIER